MEKIISINPANLDIVWEGYSASEEEVLKKISAAKESFDDWSNKKLEDRLAIINQFTKLIEINKDKLRQLIVEETGKSYQDAASEVAAVIGKQSAAVAAYKERSPASNKRIKNTLVNISHQPLGVMAVLGPFNFPAHLPNGHIIPALLAGNTIVFKPSEKTPKVGEFMIDLWHQAGTPKGVIDIVQGYGKIANFIVTHNDIDGVLFTGGVEVGRKIHKALAGKVEKLLALELGGNNPLVVWNNSNNLEASKIIIQSAFISSGQRCTCARRLIIEKNFKGAALLRTLIQEIKKITLGPPNLNNDPFMGPVVSEESVDKILSYQQHLITNGANPLISAKRISAKKSEACYISPGLIDITDMKKHEDIEIFGPVLQVIKVDSFDQAIYEANNTKFGLSAGLISTEDKLFAIFKKKVRAGIITYNLPTVGASPYAPFGGIGQSGNHRPAGYYSSDYVVWPKVAITQE